VVGESENPPRFTGRGFDLAAAAAERGDGIEADAIRVNRRAMIVFAKFISGQTQNFDIIQQPGDDFNCIQPRARPPGAFPAGR